MLHIITLVAFTAVVFGLFFPLLEWFFDHLRVICLTSFGLAAVAYGLYVLGPYVEWGKVGAYSVLAFTGLGFILWSIEAAQKTSRFTRRYFNGHPAPPPAFLSDLAETADLESLTGLPVYHPEYGEGTVQRPYENGVLAHFSSDESVRIVPITKLRTSWIGRRVFHRRFGNGTVRAVAGGMLTIDFDRAGQKRVNEGLVEAI